MNIQKTLPNPFICPTQSSFSFEKNSTIGCGGYSPTVYKPTDLQQVKDAVRRCQKNERKWFVVGNMSNVLPPDGESECDVLSVKGLQKIHIDGEYVTVGAGVTASKLIATARQFNLSGVEFLTGIPCTIGGASYMNAGVSGKYICDIIDTVYVLRDGDCVALTVNECKYGYKSSCFMQTQDIILGVKLKLKRRNKVFIDDKLQIYNLRRQHLPKGKSMGCVFKNPEGKISARLIEGANLKGLRIGGAVISPKHANFIINENKATSSDVKSLIAVVKKRVLEQYNLFLEEEIRYLT